MPKTVVISGYDEFEYARQAIELDVLAYLIKPLKKEELVKALTKAMGELDQELSLIHIYHGTVLELLVHARQQRVGLKRLL